MKGRIQVHKHNVVVTPIHRDIQWDICIDGVPFVRCNCRVGDWRAWLVDGSCHSGDFYRLAEAKAWGRLQAERHLRGEPPISHKGQYGEERAHKEPQAKEMGK